MCSALGPRARYEVDVIPDRIVAAELHGRIVGALPRSEEVERLRLARFVPDADEQLVLAARRRAVLVLDDARDADLRIFLRVLDRVGRCAVSVLGHLECCGQGNGRIRAEVELLLTGGDLFKGLSLTRLNSGQWATPLDARCTCGCSAGAPSSAGCAPATKHDNANGISETAGRIVSLPCDTNQELEPATRTRRR